LTAASGAVHPFDLPIGPWMIDIGEAVLNSQILGIAYRTYVPSQSTEPHERAFFGRSGKIGRRKFFSSTWLPSSKLIP